MTDLTRLPLIHPRFILGIVFILVLSSIYTFSITEITYGGEAMDQQTLTVLTKEDTGREIKVKCGDVIQIELKTMGAAGYNWFFEKLDEGYLELIAKEMRRAFREDLVGGPQLGVWSFKTRKKGITEIKMAEYRSWEGIGKSIEKFSIKLAIE